MEATARRVADAVEAFLLAKRVGNLSTHTLDAYRRWLDRFCQTGGAADPLVVRRFFSDLQGRGLKPSSVHTAYRTLKTFFRWCLEVGAITEDPLRGFAVRVPRTLPSVPTEDELRATLECPVSHGC